MSATATTTGDPDDETEAKLEPQLVSTSAEDRQLDVNASACAACARGPADHGEGETRIMLVKNNIRKGVVGAIRTGFEQVEPGPILVVMADLSDDLARVDRMLQLHSEGYHIVVGSRYMKGGKLVGGLFLSGVFRE